MEKIKGYESAATIQEVEKLPAGGYIVGLLDANEISYSWGKALEIKFDICEGEYKNFFTNQYKNSQFENKKYKGIYRMNIPKDDGTDLDNATIRKFKTDIIAIEESNPSFHWDWDEKKMVGCRVGCVMFEKEWDYEGKTGFFTTCHSFRNIEIIREGKFKIPSPKLLNTTEKTTQKNTVNINSAVANDLPFN